MNAMAVSRFRRHRAGCGELYKTQGSCQSNNVNVVVVNIVIVYCVKSRAAARKPGVQSQEYKEDKKMYKLGTSSPSPLHGWGKMAMLQLVPRPELWPISAACSSRHCPP